MPRNVRSTSQGWTDPDDAPAWSDDVIARAALWHGDHLVEPAKGMRTRGRPKLANPKRQVTLRLDQEILDGFRETGPGWQGRINEALRKALKA